MSDWTWEYEPDAENVVGGLGRAQRLEVEAIAQRIADAVGDRRIGKPERRNRQAAACMLGYLESQKVLE
ncbi:hypothetical protein [Streptomyces purpureus]|uniref:Uncharacterized protein n=1 Tax=Streptomyces purpureus TaxID=1951 RepID=A0A918H9B5_9ACTN|nr:hypothetical protein [Streptomyces purpureus]GGT42875.1 hypothetical protein GCM10014713_40800 [Streptomyces purpureus]